MNFKVLSLVFMASFGLSPVAFATEVEARFQTSALSFSGGRGFTNAKLLITGPDDFEAEETASRGLPTFRVQGGKVKDGFYQFALSAATDEKIKIKRQIDNGRGSDARDHLLKPFNMTGIFEIQHGKIVPPSEMEAGADVDPEEKPKNN